MRLGAGGFGGFDFEEFAGADVVEVAVDGNGVGDERVIADAGDVVDDRLLLIFDRKPFDVFAGARAGTLADVAEAGGSEFGGFEAGIQKIAHDVVGEEFHAAIGVMDDEKFLSAQQLVADDEGADGVITGAAAGIADHVGVAFGEAREFGGVEAGIHAGEDGEAAGRRKRQLALFAEIGGVVGVGLKNFGKNFAHGVLSLIARIELLNVSLPDRSFATAPQKQKSPRRESWATDDRVAESGKTRHSTPPAHGGDNTYRRKLVVGRGDASERWNDETSESGYAGKSKVSIAGCGAMGVGC